LLRRDSKHVGLLQIATRPFGERIRSANRVPDVGPVLA